MQQYFLNRAIEGRAHPRFYLFAMLSTWGAFLFVGAIPLIVLMGYLYTKYPDFFADLQAGKTTLDWPIPEVVFFSVTLLNFAIGWVGLWLGTKYVLKRHISSFITAARRIRWGRMGLGLGMWIALMAVFAFAIALREPGMITYEPNWDQFLVYLPVILILIPIQASFEEVAIRGQLLQVWYLRSGFRTLMPLLFSSFLFALLHSYNPESTQYGWGTMMLLYFSMGLILGIFTILEDGLELSIGIHVGNNLFAALFLGFDGSTLDTPTLFRMSSFTPILDLLSIVGGAVAIFAILYGRRPGILRKILINGIEENEKES